MSLPGKASPLEEQPTGSPGSGEPVFLVVGKLRRPHGLRGEIILDVLTDFPERIRPGITLYAGARYQPLVVRSRRKHNAGLLLSFHDLSSPEDVGEWRNEYVYVRAEDRPPLPEGEYYHHQMMGLDVVSDTGLALGQVQDILETGANDVLVVRGEIGPEVLLPWVDEIVLEVDLAAGKMLVHLTPGLLPGD